MLAIAGGIAFATRIQYIIVLITIVICIIIYKARSWIFSKDGIFKPWQFWDTFMALALSIPLGMALWPYFWNDPFSRLIALFRFYYILFQLIKFSLLQITEFFGI